MSRRRHANAGPLVFHITTDDVGGDGHRSRRPRQRGSFAQTVVVLSVLVKGLFLLVRHPSTSTDMATATRAKTVDTNKAIEDIDVSKLLRLPSNATYPRVYKRGDTFHIIKTLFMQYQCNLVELGQARLKLFETFCLPAMIHQTSQNFFWLVYVDPELNESFLQKLKELFAPFPHFYIVLSSVQKFGQGGKDILRKNGPEDFVTGDVHMIFANLRYVHRLQVLETRLDADDGLHIHYVEALQTRASEVFSKETDMGPREWMFWCIPHTTEWYWESNENQSSTLGVLGFSRNDTADEVCHKAGLTLGVARGTDIRTVARARADMLYQQFKEEQKSCGGPYSGLKCLDFVTELEPGGGALQSRTPVAAMVATVNVTATMIPTTQQKVELWKMAIRDFAVAPENVRAFTSRFSDRMQPIREDANRCRCSLFGSYPCA
jgi:hypothetical protein